MTKCCKAVSPPYGYFSVFNFKSGKMARTIIADDDSGLLTFEEISSSLVELMIEEGGSVCEVQLTYSEAILLRDKLNDFVND